jgi:peroxiredoxin Q/BCP
LNGTRVKTSRILWCGISAGALLAALPVLGAPPLPALAGQDAPVFSGQDEDGNPWRLSDHLGKRIVFLYFYPKDDTAGCTAEACSLRDSMAELRQSGVDVVGVSFDDKATHKDFIFKYNLDFPLLADTNGFISDAYGARMGEHTKMGSLAFSAEEIRDLPGIVKRLTEQSDPLSVFLWNGLSKSDQALLRGYVPSSASSTSCRDVVAEALRKIIGGPILYQEKRFKSVSLRPETAALLKKNLKGASLAYLNRLLLEDSFPAELSRRQRMDRRVSFLIGLDGKILHVTDSPDPAVHVKELAAAMESLRGKAGP